jgi:hypothetical protein
VNRSLGEKRVAVNGPYLSFFFDHDAMVSGPNPVLQECPNVGRTRLIFLANSIGVLSLLAAALSASLAAVATAE